MCGACGAPVTDWTERLAPLTPASAAHRAATLTALLRCAPSATARRVTAQPWPGDGLRLRHPAGWWFAGSLLEAVDRLTARHGPLIPPLRPTADRATQATLPFTAAPPAVAVWCAALLAAEVPRDNRIALHLGDRSLVPHDAAVTLDPPGPEATANRLPSLRAEHRAQQLADHWGTVLRPSGTP